MSCNANFHSLTLFILVQLILSIRVATGNKQRNTYSYTNMLILISIFVHTINYIVVADHRRPQKKSGNAGNATTAKKY